MRIITLWVREALPRWWFAMLAVSGLVTTALVATPGGQQLFESAVSATATSKYYAYLPMIFK